VYVVNKCVLIPSNSPRRSQIAPALSPTAWSYDSLFDFRFDLGSTIFVQIYRCYVVRNNNILVTIPPTLMLIAATGQCPFNTVSSSSRYSLPQVLGIIVSCDLNLTAYPFFALSLATNVLVTILTGEYCFYLGHVTVSCN
jgi:hypothetical protein